MRLHVDRTRWFSLQDDFKECFENILDEAPSAHDLKEPRKTRRRAEMSYNSWPLFNIGSKFEK
jgi:hypothetical protein